MTLFCRALSLALLLGFTSCQAPTVKTHAERTPQSHRDLQTWLDRAVALTTSPELNAATCERTLDALLEQAAPVDPLSVSEGLSFEQVKSIESHLVQTLFQTRMNLHARIAELTQGQKDQACLNSIRKYFVSLRQIEELFLDHLVSKKMSPLQDEETESAFKIGFPATLINPQFSQLEFKAGDVLLDRGDSAVSAQIARIGDVENMFSHAMIIGEDPKGRLYIVETTPEDIVGMIPIKEYFEENPDSRMALYRFQDSKLAQKAGRFIYDHVKKAGRPLLYDFQMNDRDASEFFCSEVVQFAYREASGGRVLLPMVKTDLSRFQKMANHNWITRMGVQDREVFSPSDIDVDPRFTPVAEYRFIPALRERRLDDATMTAMYDWMLTKDYHFTNDLRDAALSHVAIAAARLGLQKSLARNLTRPVVIAALEFDRVFANLKAKIKAVSEREESLRKKPLPIARLLEIAEDVRQNDCQRYRLAREVLPDREGRAVDFSEFIHASFESPTACRSSRF